ncbi:MAG: hypothetical protein Q8M11_14320 [Sulfuritalea sp.]|nr:hypothetical protein [Sulfuritalea sp.]MDP1984073.1 hypothetical protein [Sulfuritalea sp.]
MFYRICRRGWDWAVRKPDFVADFGEADIHRTLSALARAGRIRRACLGVCDYPRHDDPPGQARSPDIDQVARLTAAQSMTMKSMAIRI